MVELFPKINKILKNQALIEQNTIYLYGIKLA